MRLHMYNIYLCTSIQRKEKPSTRKLIYRQTAEELLIAIVLAICGLHINILIHTKGLTESCIYINIYIYIYIYNHICIYS